MANCQSHRGRLSPLKKANKEEEIVEARIVGEETQDDAPRPVKKKKKKKPQVAEKFELTLSNGILFGVLSVALLVAFLLFRENKSSSIILLCASILLLTIIPAIISFASWAALKNKSICAIAFNAFLVLVFSANIFFIVFINNKSNEKKAIEIIDSFKSENETATQKWTTALRALAEPRMRNLYLLKNEGEFAYRKKIINAHKDETIAYINHFKSMESELNRRLLEMANNDPSASTIHSQLMQHVGRRMFIAENLANMHITLANALLELHDTLENKPSAWTVTGNQLVFRDNEVSKKINSLAEGIDKLFDDISQYSSKLSNTR